MGGDGPDRFGCAIPDQAGIGRDAVAMAAAEMGGQAPAAALCGQIPERDVEPGQREKGDAVASPDMQLLLQCQAEGRYVLDGLSRHQRRDRVGQHGADGGGAAIGESLAPADAAVIRGDPDEDGVELRPAARLAPRPRPEIAERYLESDRFDLPVAHGSGTTLQGSEIYVDFSASERTSVREIVVYHYC